MNVYQKKIGSPDLEITNRAYSFYSGTDGQIWGLTAGDHGYEPTGLVVDDDTFEIWKLGLEAYYKSEQSKKSI